MEQCRGCGRGPATKLVVNWFYLAGNLVAHRKASRLAQPTVFEYAATEREAA
jgi:hypothetical protein